MESQVAQELAKSLDLELTDWHFEVLAAVRQFYQQFGHSPATRPLIKFLMKTVSPDINNAVLQQKFNTGLVARHLSRLASVYSLNRQIVYKFLCEFFSGSDT